MYRHQWPEGSGVESWKLRRQNFKVVHGGEGAMTYLEPDTQTPELSQDLQADDLIDAVEALEAQLYGENWFLDQVRNSIRDHLDLESDDTLKSQLFETITSNIGHDYIIHIAQFYFLLRALDCQSVDKIDNLMDSHNSKIETRILSGNEIMKSAQLKTAVFKSSRKANIRDTFSFYGRPIFAISEIASFLFDAMSPTKTTSVMKDLLKGGVFRRLDEDQTVDAPISTDPRRILVEPSSTFVEDYARSLLMTRGKMKKLN